MRPPFDPKGPLTVLKPLSIEGRVLQRGARVPPATQRDLSSSTLRGLWAQGYFECAESLEAAAAFVDADTAKAFRSMNGGAPAGPLGSIEHVGGGYYLLKRPGQPDQRVKGKAAAEAALAAPAPKAETAPAGDPPAAPAADPAPAVEPPAGDPPAGG